jgi:hypothetical protein
LGRTLASPGGVLGGHVIGFVDILGFREHVAQAAADPNVFTTLLNSLTAIATQPHSLAGSLDDFRVTSFSDCIVASTRITDSGLWKVVLFCDALQFNLWPNGILFRGAISKGAMHHDDKILFGPALVEAYDLETRTATHPRIMLAEPVYQDAIASQRTGYFPNYVNQYILTLPFDVPCINPFADYQNALAGHQSVGLQRFAAAKTIIERHLQGASGKPGLVEKWIWLARVYNDLIHKTGIAGNPGIAAVQY